jgi:hypothetical protein
MKIQQDPKCLNCNIEFESRVFTFIFEDGVKAINNINYCPECLYINSSETNLTIKK